MRFHLPIVVLWVLLNIIGTEGRPPTDTPRRHVQTITSSRHTYRVNMPGTMDGQNTRSLLGSSAAWEQRFEPMRFARIENIDDVNVVNPWICLTTPITPQQLSRESIQQLTFLICTS